MKGASGAYDILFFFFKGFPCSLRVCFFPSSLHSVYFFFFLLKNFLLPLSRSDLTACFRHTPLFCAVSRAHPIFFFVVPL